MKILQWFKRKKKIRPIYPEEELRELSIDELKRLRLFLISDAMLEVVDWNEVIVRVQKILSEKEIALQKAKKIDYIR